MVVGFTLYPPKGRRDFDLEHLKKRKESFIAFPYLKRFYDNMGRNTIRSIL